MDERLQMHVEDFDVSRWERGEPPNQQRARSQLLEKAARSHTCNACLKPLPLFEFTRRTLNKGLATCGAIVCEACEAQGFSRKDTSTYRCCYGQYGHTMGHLAFDSQHLRDWKRGRCKILLCRQHRDTEKVVKFQACRTH